MGKLIKIILIGIPVLIIVAILVLGLSLNSVIKAGVEKVGPMATGTDVRLNDVDISIFSGKGELSGIVIGNPSGFKSPSAFSLNKVRVALDVGSVFSDKIIIDEIYIDAPEVTYETGGKGTNIKTIVNNINSFSGTSDSPAAKEPAAKAEGEGTKIQINNLIVKNGKVNLSVTALGGQGVSKPLPDIHLKDIGKDGGGATMADAFKKIFAAVNKNVGTAVAGSLKDVTGDVQKAAEGEVEKAVGGALDKVKGIFGK